MQPFKLVGRDIAAESSEKFELLSQQWSENKNRLSTFDVSISNLIDNYQMDINFHLSQVRN